MKSTNQILKDVDKVFVETSSFKNTDSAILVEDVKDIINKDRIDLLDEVLSLYVLDGNPEVWKNKIEKLRNELRPYENLKITT